MPGVAPQRNVYVDEIIIVAKNVEGVSIGSRKGSSSRKGCAVDGYC